MIICYMYAFFVDFMRAYTRNEQKPPILNGILCYDSIVATNVISILWEKKNLNALCFVAKKTRGIPHRNVY